MWGARLSESPRSARLLRELTHRRRCCFHEHAELSGPPQPFVTLPLPDEASRRVGDAPTRSTLAVAAAQAAKNSSLRWSRCHSTDVLQVVVVDAGPRCTSTRDIVDDDGLAPSCPVAAARSADSPSAPWPLYLADDCSVTRRAAGRLGGWSGAKAFAGGHATRDARLPCEGGRSLIKTGRAA
jgi:hypothetical protein